MVDCNIILKVNTPTRLRIRSIPSTDGELLGYLNDKDIIIATKKEGLWFYHSDIGWSLSEDDDNKYLTIYNKARDIVLYDDDIEDPDDPDDTEDPDNPDDTEDPDEDDEPIIIELEQEALTSDEIKMYRSVSYEDYSDSNEQLMSSLQTENLSGIFGIPYQFSAEVDARISNYPHAFGRKYAEKIIAPMPVLFMSPGRPEYMRSFSKAEKKSIINNLADTFSSNAVDVDDIIENYGRYYTFKFAYDDYYKYVNQNLNMLSSFMGIGNTEVTIGKYTSKLRSFEWQKSLNSSFSQYLDASEAIPFYMDSETSINESFSNSTTESLLSQKANSMSDQGRELTFLLGASGGQRLDAFLKSFAGTAGNTLTNMASSVVGIGNTGVGNSAKNVFSSLNADFQTIIAGGKLSFPEIWADSDFTRSYSLNFKFRSPDADNLSIFLNVYVPLVHLMAFAAPQQLGANGYTSPFIIRAFYKGIFNCDMGMITSLDCTRGKENCWNANGLPTVMDVSMTIKDLYSDMFLSTAYDVKYINNTSLIDYLCTLAGLNLNKPEISRTLTTYAITLNNRVVKTPSNVWQGVKNDISNLISGYYKVK